MLIHDSYIFGIQPTSVTCNICGLDCISMMIILYNSSEFETKSILFVLNFPWWKLLGENFDYTFYINFIARMYPSDLPHFATHNLHPPSILALFHQFETNYFGFFLDHHLLFLVRSPVKSLLIWMLIVLDGMMEGWCATEKRSSLSNGT